MNDFISSLQKYQITILALVLCSFICAFLHLQNFDPTHPTQMNASCIQGLPQCASYKDALFTIVNILLFFSGLYALLHVCKPSVNLNIRVYMEDVMYVPILLDPISFELRKGILHSKYH